MTSIEEKRGIDQIVRLVTEIEGRTIKALGR